MNSTPLMISAIKKEIIKITAEEITSCSIHNLLIKNRLIRKQLNEFTEIQRHRSIPERILN